MSCGCCRDASDIYNAITDVCFADALQAAREVDSRLKAGGLAAPPKPLDGTCALPYSDPCLHAVLAPSTTGCHVVRLGCLLPHTHGNQLYTRDRMWGERA